MADPCVAAGTCGFQLRYNTSHIARIVGMRVRVAILGLGAVGLEVAKTLRRERALFSERIGEDIEVGHVLVRDLDKPRPEDLRALITTDAEEVFTDESVEIVVEVMGGSDPARGYIERALRTGRSVVTANKEVIANTGPELSRLASPGAALLFEAAVAGGIPIIRALQESLQGNRIQSLYGIVNGSTNFLLTRMHESGEPFSAALSEAKALGYLEADPSDDLDGVDAARKIAILAGLAFGGFVPVSAVARTGIRSVSADDVRAAGCIGGRIKLVASAASTDEGVFASVAPTVLGPSHPLAHVDGPQNAVYVRAEPVGEVLLAGLGAGGRSTSSAVIGDIIAAARMRRYGGRSPELPLEPCPLIPESAAESALAVRLTAPAGTSGDLVAGAFRAVGIDLRDIRQTMDGPDRAEYLAITLTRPESLLQRSLDALARNERWLAVESSMRADFGD